MSLTLAIRINTPVADCSVFGEITILRGSRLVDALIYLRSLARDGVRSRSEIDYEAARLIDNSRSIGGK